MYYSRRLEVRITEEEHQVLLSNRLGQEPIAAVARRLMFGETEVVPTAPATPPPVGQAIPVPPIKPDPAIIGNIEGNKKVLASDRAAAEKVVCDHHYKKSAMGISDVCTKCDHRRDHVQGTT